mgnify:CR=1 FL=1
MDGDDPGSGLSRMKCKDSGHEYLPVFLSFLSPETGGGIWEMTLYGCPQENAAPILYAGYSEDSLQLVYEPAWKKAQARFRKTGSNVKIKICLHSPPSIGRCRESIFI